MNIKINILVLKLKTANPTSEELISEVFLNQ